MGVVKGLYTAIILTLIISPVFAITATAYISPTSLTLDWGQSAAVGTYVKNNNFFYSINCQSTLDGSSWTPVVRISNGGQTKSVSISVSAPTTSGSVITTTIPVTTRCISDDTSDSPQMFYNSVSLTYPTQAQFDAY